VASDCALIKVRSFSSCARSLGFGPEFLGNASIFPVVRRRRFKARTNDSLTSNRSATAFVLPPLSHAFSIRLRKSNEYDATIHNALL
jgi:hypothetical protein